MRLFLFIGVLALHLLSANPTMAGYTREAKTEIDPSIMRIKEFKYLGNPVNQEFAFVDSAGEEFRLKDMLGQPLILLLSYFTCDGVCSTLNLTLKGLLNGIDQKMGKDFKILTASFDKYDGPETMKMFETTLGLSETQKEAWKIAVLKNKEDIRALTQSVGYRFFWSKPDRMFLHPSVLIFLSPDGRITRYLYSTTIGPKDVRLALLDASRGTATESNATELKDLLLVACYSYNFKEGKYGLNYPLFIGAGTLLATLMIVATALIRVLIKKRREEGLCERV